MLVEIIGWIGGILFAICAIPQAYDCYKQKHGKGLSWLFLILCIMGEICTLIYVSIDRFSWSLIINYIANLIALTFIVYYKWYGEKHNN